jgi:hypothetical protein
MLSHRLARLPSGRRSKFLVLVLWLAIASRAARPRVSRPA